MAVDITPIQGYLGSIEFDEDTLDFKSWSLSSNDSMLDATTGGASFGYQMALAGIVSYTAQIEMQLDTTATSDVMQHLQPGEEFTDIIFNKDSATPVCTFSNATEGTSAYAGFITSMNVVCNVEGIVTMSIGVQLNGKPTFAAS